VSDWQVGDKALCVDAGPDRFYGDVGLTLGRIYTVVGLPMGNQYDRWKEGLELGEVRPPKPSVGYASYRFRKIRPDEHEDCEPEFVELLNRSKRKVSA
jgi:hypothetical protein